MAARRECLAAPLRALPSASPVAPLSWHWAQTPVARSASLPPSTGLLVSKYGRLVPTAGAIPLSPSLDTACAMTRSVRDATLVHALLSGQPTLII